MTSTYSASYRFELPADGDRSGTWGQMLNTFMGTLLEDALSGVSAVSMTSDANYTLVTSSGASDETRRLVLNVTSTATLTATRNVIAPAAKKRYIVYNGTTGGQSIQIIGATGTGITIANGKKRAVYFDGTNFVDEVSDLASGTTLNNVTIVTDSGTQTLTNKTITYPTLTVKDASFTMQDNVDTAKQAVFELSGITTGNTRTLTVPDLSGTLALTAGAQTFSNKTLDNTTTIAIKATLFGLPDDGDATKILKFELSGITTGNSRTASVADGDFTIGGMPINAQTGTTYTVVVGDRGKLVTLSNASAVAVTLPQATGAGFKSGFYVFFKNKGAGTVTITPTTSAIDGGTALILRTNQWGAIWSDNTDYQCVTTGSITGNPNVTSVGTRGIPVNTQDAAYGFLIEDAGTIIRHSSASAHTYTIPANASVAFPVGTAITIVNEPGGGSITLSITTDTLNRGDGVSGTGSRTIAANSVATVMKTAATTWMITGSFT